MLAGNYIGHVHGKSQQTNIFDIWKLEEYNVEWLALQHGAKHFQKFSFKQCGYRIRPSSNYGIVYSRDFDNQEGVMIVHVLYTKMQPRKYTGPIMH